MYKINAPAVYAHDTVMSDPVYRARVESVTRSLVTPRSIITFRDADLPSLIQRDGILKRRVPMGTLTDLEDPILLFHTFRFQSDEERALRVEELAKQGLAAGSYPDSLLGAGAFRWACYNLKEDPARNDKVCRPGWHIHLTQGCLHRCLYCPMGGLLVCRVNVEEYCVHLSKIIEQHPWQKTYLLDDDGDTPCLEPELGCLGRLIEFFGTLKDRYLIIHTKTWNTSWMKGLKHNGNTIIVWSLSGPTQSRRFEPNTGTTEERIEAARVAEEAGYQIRYKFKPILPVKNWREEAAYTIERLFAVTHPDVISMCVYMWMDIDEVKKRFAQVLDLLDPQLIQAAEDGRAEVADTLTKPFPEHVRAAVYGHYLDEIRKHHKDIPVSLSTESWRMWNHFGPRLGMTATNYICACGPMASPREGILSVHPYHTAVRHDGPVPDVVEVH